MAVETFHLVLCMKSLDGTYAQNALSHGVAGLNIDECRVAIADNTGVWGSSNATCNAGFNDSPEHANYRSQQHPSGRWPANLLLSCSCSCFGEHESECPVAILDAQSGVSTSVGGHSAAGAFRNGEIYGNGRDKRREVNHGFGDNGGASRFFMQIHTEPYVALDDPVEL